MQFFPIFLMFILFACGVPVALALIGCTLPYFLLFVKDMPVDLLMQRLIASLESETLLAIPFFIMSGVIMAESGIIKRLLAFADCLVGHITGSLALVNVLLSTLMGGISGSASADAASDCKMLVPAMKRYGYPMEYSAAVTVASAMVTPIIPPGTGLILYSFVVGASVGRMFLAGYIPGFMMCIGLCLLVHRQCVRMGIKPTREKVASRRETLKAAKDAIWALLLPFGIIMLIRLGFCTASETGAICCAYSLFVGVFVYKEITLKNLGPMVKEALTSTAAVLLILCAANVFSWYLSYERIPYMLTEMVLEMNLSRYAFLIIVNILLLCLGMFMDGGAVLMITVPLLWPIASSLGIDIIHFGLICVLNCQIGLMTPPFGMTLFVVSALLKVSISKLSKALIPFIIILLIALLLVTFVPELSLFLPDLVYGS